MESEKNVKAMLIIEILGKPADYVEQTLHGLIDKLGQEENIEILSKKFYEPKPTETLFIAFSEVEIAVPSLFKLLEICFKYMPSSVEISEPADLKFNLNDANMLINGLMTRLHQYDAIAKKITFENNILKNQLQQIASNPVQKNSEKPDKKEKAKPKSRTKSKHKKK